jgi:hypothetical protein
VTVNDWLLANQRTNFARTVERLGESLEKMRESLLEALESGGCPDRRGFS